MPSDATYIPTDEPIPTTITSPGVLLLPDHKEHRVWGQGPARKTVAPFPRATNDYAAYPVFSIGEDTVVLVTPDTGALSQLAIAPITDSMSHDDVS